MTKYGGQVLYVLSITFHGMTCRCINMIVNIYGERVDGGIDERVDGEG